MLTELANAESYAPVIPHNGQNVVPIDSLSIPEIYQLFDCDMELPQRIRANFRQISILKSQLLSQVSDAWDKKTESLFLEFERAVREHLRTVSVDMYVAVRNRLNVEEGGGLERFKIFEDKAYKNYELVGVFLLKYHRSNQFFKPEFAIDLERDIERVMGIMTDQLGRERAFLFPLYIAGK